MEEESNGIDALLDVIQHRLGDIVGVAFDKGHWLTKSQGTHYVVAVMDAYLVDQNGLSKILTDSDKELARELLHPGGIVRKRCSNISLSVA